MSSEPKLSFPEPVLVWDYERGTVVDARTGEVVDAIYVASYVDGFGRSSNKDFSDRVHYGVVEKYMFVDMEKDQKRAYALVKQYLASAGIHLGYPELLQLAKAIKLLWRDALVFRSSARRVSAVAPAVAFAFIVSRGGYRQLKKICEEMGIDSGGCREAGKLVVKAMKVFGTDFGDALAAAVLSYPDAEVAKVALTLSKYAKTSGCGIHSLAAALIYVASLLLGREAYICGENGVAKHFGAAPISVRLVVKQRMPFVRIRRSASGAVEAVELAKEVCREVAKVARLSEKVVCR
jgi:Transcription initiation factor TFIIIB, Brf1 subunit/Transcription initiation factor TFIIB